ncbi:hypothetical protein BDF14DRAFT_1839909 [Spinellus fusiger]|nr:hypothetical protein BDF14DRAFT_1839909 [Spinellus fusiger]
MKRTWKQLKENVRVRDKRGRLQPQPQWKKIKSRFCYQLPRQQTGDPPLTSLLEPLGLSGDEDPPSNPTPDPKVEITITITIAAPLEIPAIKIKTPLIEPLPKHRPPTTTETLSCGLPISANEECHVLLLEQQQHCFLMVSMLFLP